MTDPLRVGVTYLPHDTGIHQWQEFSARRMAHDLALVRAQGFGHLRVHLAWDAFMPTHRRVDRHRLRDLDALLGVARAQGLLCELVLLAQSHGDCLQLPAYAVDRRRPRRGVRIVVGGRVVEGGPRDLWADPLMLEAAELWLRTLLEAFGNHPALAGWDLGHDPAATLRPRRLEQMVRTIEVLAATVRRRQDRVHLTLGAGDVFEARGVRLAPLAAAVDSLGLLIDPQRLPVEGAGAAAAAAFTLALAQRLAAVEGRVPPLEVVTGLAVDDHPELPPPGVDGEPPRWDVDPLTPGEAARVTSELLGRLDEGGARGLWATSWCVGGSRALAAPPCDRLPALGRHGLAAGDGELRAHGRVWSELALRESAVQAPAPLAATLDAEAYYANLPDSARDLWAAWRGDQDGASARD
ncbi:MAG TPA: hypothetical protein VI316_10725 [Candidatus Dormibacteraeota bacterium]